MNRHRVAWLVAGSIVGVLALAMLAGGAWALAKDRGARDAGGFLSITSTNQVRTDTYALTAELRGDGPGWLYGSKVLGDARFRVTSQSGQPVFVGIAPTSDVSRYLDGTGYATIEHIATGAVTTHAGRAPAQLPAQLSIWAASTEGTSQQTLRWAPRAGDWSILVMNKDASAGVAVRGDIYAKVPVLPWLALGLLLAAATFGGLGTWLLVLGIRVGQRPSQVAGDQSQGSMPRRVPTGVGS